MPTAQLELRWQSRAHHGWGSCPLAAAVVGPWNASHLEACDRQLRTASLRGEEASVQAALPLAEPITVKLLTAPSDA